MFEIITGKNFGNSSWRKETFYSAWKDVPHCIFFIFLIASSAYQIKAFHQKMSETKFFKKLNPIFVNLINISQVMLLYFLENKKTGEGI